jgi:hypothetical protein
MENLKQATELINFAIDHIKDCQPSCYGCDLHNEIFNSDYYIIGRYEAEQWLTNNGGVFHNIDLVKEYEQSNFGEVNTDLSEPEHIVNMVVYILGEEVLSVSKTLQSKWNNKLDDEDLKAIINELQNSI